MTSPPPFFSIVVPTYNRLQMLRRALKSIAEQTFKDYEVLIVDDCSSDATPEFLASLDQKQYRALKNPQNSGVSASRNLGCRSAIGEFIVFLDDDDSFRPSALAAIKAKQEANPKLDFFWGGRDIHEKDSSGRLIGRRIDDWSRFSGPLSGSDFLPLVLEIATSAAFAIRRSSFEALGGFDEGLKVSEDRDLFIRIARNGNLGSAVTETIIDIDEHFTQSLSRNTAVRYGPTMDLKVISRHREYLERPEHRRFLNNYLLVLFCGFLQAGERTSAMRMCAELYRHHALNSRVFRMYLRYAPEFRLFRRMRRNAPAAIRRQPQPRLSQRTPDVPPRKSNT